MSFPLELQNRSLAEVIIEASICLAMNIISVIGNVLVCLAVYKNPKLRSPTNLYIIALAATRSDLLCATVEMSLTSAVFELLEGGIYGDAVCQLQGFVEEIRCVLNSSNDGIHWHSTGTYESIKTKLLQQDLLTAQVESVAELRVAFSRFVSADGSNDKLDHI